ncbi:MAG: glycosyltransferase family 2 protein [Verrucomicrobiae bacterium]|nr:glycosyltransferase family 2 protein [Verrucomicrobiae bacterium]
MKPRSITALFPAYNDADVIGDLVRVALEALSQVTHDYEVVVVNDGSTDRTASVLDELVERHPMRVRAIHHPRNLGYGRALRTGFAHARKEWVFYTDGDGQYDPWEMLDLVAALQPEVDVVNGYKTVRCDPLHRIVVGWLYSRFARLAFGIRLRDVDCDFRLIRRALLQQVELQSDNGAVCVEMIRKFQDVGGRFVEVPVSHYHRAFGSSQFFRPHGLCRVALQLARLWFGFFLSARPAPAARLHLDLRRHA